MLGCDLYEEIKISGNVCIFAVLDSIFKLWMHSVCYCRIEEIDVFYIDLPIDKLYSFNVLCRGNDVGALLCSLIEIS